MIKNRIVSVLYMMILSSCIAYAQTSGRWINFYEDEDGFYSYRSNIKSDRDGNNYVWIKCNITSPRGRMKIANNIESSTPVYNVLFNAEFDSDYELVKLVHIRALSNSGKVLFEAKFETLGKWEVVDDVKNKLFYILSKQLKSQPGGVYEEHNRRSDRVYPETNSQSGRVYERLLEKIKDKQAELERGNGVSDNKKETPHKLLVSNIEYGATSESKVTNTNGLLNMIDGKPSTAWIVNLDQASYDCDAMYGPIFTLHCKKLTHIAIHNGYAKSYEAYRNNARALRLIFCNYDYLSDENKQASYLFEGIIKDTPEEQTLVVDAKRYCNDDIKKIQIIFPVDGLRYGTKWNALCVSEIEFWGY